MICFEVSINGRKLCTAGVGQYGVLTTILSWAKNEPEQENTNQEELKESIHFHVGGLVDQVHISWLPEDVMVNQGDEISIKIIEGDNPDEPIEGHDASDPEEARRSRYEAYQIYKREFEALDKAGNRIEPSDPENAKLLRRAIYEEYKQEFENEA